MIVNSEEGKENEKLKVIILCGTIVKQVNMTKFYLHVTA